MMRCRPASLFSGVALLVLGFGGSANSLAAGNTNLPPAQRVVIASSPVTAFRELLVMTQTEREEALMLRPLGLREPLEAKVQEYLALTPEARELRLQATELRHCLLQLMPLPATHHAAALAEIPEPMRSLVATRLETWSLLPPPLQDEVLESEQAVRYLTQLGDASPAQREAVLEGLSAAQRIKIEADIKRWQALPETTRRRMFAQFSQFFDLTAPEREKALGSLSVTERDAMEKALSAFGELTPSQRATCIHSFEKFASMSLTERQQFLKKAGAWERMTPTEREQWRELVARIPDLPPLPEGFVLPGMNPSPSPPPPPKAVPAAKPLATNGG